MRNRSHFSDRAAERRARKGFNRRRSRLLTVRPLLEVLEDRRLLTGNTLYVNDNWAITNDVAPAGLSAGDTVANTGAGDDGTVTGKIFGTNAFSTIQNAVNAANAGDTIDVLSGTYAGGVVVDKALTLIGEQHGVDARTRGAVSESIVSGTEGDFQIEADNVTIDGFTLEGVTNDPNADPGSLGTAIWTNPGFSGTHGGTQVFNNIIQGNISGIELDNDGTYQTTVQYNLFKDNTQPGAAGGLDIVTDFGLSDALIDSNTFTNTSLVEDAWAMGIQAASDGVTFSNNTVTNHGRGVYFYETTNASVTDNTITGASHYGIGVFGIDGFTPNSSFTISGNIIDESGSGGAGVELQDDTDPGTAYTGSLTLSGDQFTTTGTDSSIRNESSTSIDATGEEFNGTDATASSTAQLFAAEDTIVDGIDVAGYGLVRIKTGQVYVTPNSFFANTFPGTGTTTPDVSRAIAVASTGDTVNIAAGTYSGDIDASGKALTIAPGGSGASALVTITGNLILSSLDTLAIDINGPTAGTQYDEISTTGTVNLNSDHGTGAVLSPTLALAYTPLTPTVFTIISNGSASPVAPAAPTPKFQGLPEGASIVLNGNLLTLTYVGGDNNDVLLTHVNHAPTFTAGPNQWNYINSGPQTVPNWATNISDGTGDVGQTLNFIVSNNNNALFSSQPAISPTGTLTYTPAAGASGSATVTVRLHDDGGTDLGGIDTSAPQTFFISIPTKLAITTQPPATVPVGFGFGLSVTAEDAQGNPAPGFSGSVTVALASGAGGTLGGTLVVSAVNGVATFSGLTLDKVGSGYTLRVTSGLLSSTTSIPITVVPALLINAPAINYATTFQSGGLAVVNTSGVSINDDNSIIGATVQIMNLRDGSNESLTANMGVSGLTSMYNAATGTLTITGSATAATYESVLETAEYSDVLASPTTSTRNIQFIVTDGLNLKSNVAVATVSFVSSYTEASGPGSTQSPNVNTANPTIVIDSAGVVNATSVTSATVSISSGFVGSTEDVLGLSNQFQQNFHITLSSPVPGEIVLTGTSQTTPAQYQLEMDAITYTNTSHVFAPSDLQKTFTFTINTNSGSSVSDVKTYTIVPVNTSPTVTTTASPLSYTALSGAQLVDPGVTVTDPDPLSITGATVSISSGFVSGQDTFSETAALPSGVTGAFNSTTGVYTLSGSASLTQYQTLLAGIAYTNSGLNLNSRTLTFVVNAGSLPSNVAGNNRYTKTINISPATVTRFDFNGNASTSTASGAPGFIGVGPSRGYSQLFGYGFSDAVTNFAPFTASAVETIAGISATYAPMYQDGIVSPANSPQDFTISTIAGTKYDLRVYVGNPNVSTSNIQVTIYTGSITNLQQTQIGQTSGISTTAGGANAFTTVEFDGLTAGGVTTAAGSVITVVIKSTTGNVYTEGLDVALTGHLPAIAHQDPAGGIAPAGSPAVASLTTSQLQPVVSQAIANWAAAGITPAQLATLQSTQFVITNLESQGALALTGSNTVQIDSTADGYGWFTDPSVADQPVADRMDLLTVVTHELGHILGLVDVSAAQLPGDLMDIELPTGTRRMPSAADLQALAIGSSVPTAAPAASTTPAVVVIANSPSTASSPASAAGIDQALAQVAGLAVEDDDASEDDASETATAQDGFFALLG